MAMMWVTQWVLDLLTKSEWASLKLTQQYTGEHVRYMKTTVNKNWWKMSLRNDWKRSNTLGFYESQGCVSGRCEGFTVKDTQRQDHAKLWRILELDPIINCNIAAQAWPLTRWVIQSVDETMDGSFLFQIDGGCGKEKLCHSVKLIK